MLKRNNQNRKLNNKGMSLVEIIVTVTILALVSGILLSSFVSVMRTSAKSRDVHRATTVAQNIMEGINLKTAQEMAYQFNYPIRKDGEGNNINNFKLYRWSFTCVFGLDLYRSNAGAYNNADGCGFITVGAFVL